ncbi:LURP-one-related/scramblase family protein [Paraburkholderia fungorum]|uniref:LURP-one-related/scramblase family protein n=1 Tax=Paraburkholderia fungorum TaxID=134537 RepID=UPI0016153129|nr:hypothetical protein [Paraburkholderia fungorum]MBB5546534.1 uncharacterized protein YxjI [Paraburkholderia fungorum]
MRIESETTGYWMSRILSVANKLLSIRGAIDITDGDGNLAYRGKGQFAFFSPKWRIYRENDLVGTIRRRILTWAPTWDISGELGAFAIKRKRFAFTRQYYAVGGPAHGATVSGNLWDFKFRVARAGETLAKARGRVLTVRDRHDVEVFGQPELFVVFAMLVLQMERRDERRKEQMEQES